MIANNIFKAIGDFCTNILFAPHNAIRSMDNWWLQNTVNWLFIIISFGFFIYWLRELNKYKKAGNQ
ncbi:hypothetical protein [Lutibacter sp. B1]|jgi:hypothetical protein|uniref:DUF6341 family protein n=1 Tax=Lutibacter sp. B1 TaxID=2725996 RepID=UPI001456C0C6|nr:hypothetical protein [Lutibacter sp. B1]NLP57617.1 hypothetical protein [Lutibacter sp. B1]